MGEMVGVARIAELAMNTLLGPRGAMLVAAAVVVSTLGCNAAGILPVSRVCYAMASDGLFFRRAAAVHPRFHTPHVAILFVTAWSALLTLTGTYEQLYTYVVFTALIFNVAGGAALFWLRRSQPHRHRPYRVWGYPLTPALFVASTSALVVNTLHARPQE